MHQQENRVHQKISNNDIIQQNYDIYNSFEESRKIKAHKSFAHNLYIDNQLDIIESESVSQSQIGQHGQQNASKINQQSNENIYET